MKIRSGKTARVVGNSLPAGRQALARTEIKIPQRGYFYFFLQIGLKSSTVRISSFTDSYGAFHGR